MDRAVLDTSVIVKSIFKPPKTLSSEIYKRETETHEKCRFIIKKLEGGGCRGLHPKSLRCRDCSSGEKTC